MSDPTRLLEGGASKSKAAQLLRALQPPQAAPPAVKAALGQQLSGLVAQGALPAASAAALWLKAGVVAVAVAGSGVAAWKLTSAESAPAVRAPVIAAAPSTVAEPSVAAPASEPTPEPAASEAPARAQPARSAPSEPRDRLAEEEAILEAARSSLGSSPARALALLQRHRASYPSGQLAAERMFLSVDCLRRLGRRAEAQREADALVARYPASAYARRAPLLLAPPSR
jgi:hypothetical protein